MGYCLQVHRNTYALVVSMENITLNWYWGNNRSMLMSNCLFRMGGAAVLLTNRGGSDRRRAKYQLMHTVRTHHGADDRAYRCVFQEEDETGRVGVALSKDLMAGAGEALKTNITTLGPLALPMSEQILFLASLVARKVFGVRGLRPYIPDFKMAFEHFCIHAGGRAVLDTIEKNLELSPWHMEPSRMTLYRWGNTSSSSLWYELAYTESAVALVRARSGTSSRSRSGPGSSVIVLCGARCGRLIRRRRAPSGTHGWTRSIGSPSRCPRWRASSCPDE